MAETSSGPAAGNMLIVNVGLMLSGALENPILDADSVLVRHGKIAQIGRTAELRSDASAVAPTVVVDAQGTTLTPGLIDSHVHPVFGDWTPRQSQLNWIDTMMHGGVTSMVSAGEVHLPGRAKDIVGVKALAITAQRAFDNFRPGGVKIHAGAPVIEQGMVEADFKEMADAGVKWLGEVGLGGVKQGDEAKRMVAWARQHGIQSTIHTGGPSIPGSGLIDADVVLEADADVIGHINGGPTALPLEQIRRLCEQCSRSVEIVHNGNEKAALFAMRTTMELGQSERIILGTDSPAGSGVQPLGILRLMSMLSSIGEVDPELVFCFATGNTARQRRLDNGLIEVGRAADFVIMDRAQHSAGSDFLDCIRKGDVPGISMVIIDGLVRSRQSRNTPPADRFATVED
ncbi:amidohydrolase family protein [Candidatus Entotheonella palauensis]|uniref:amidohydrolase family protein n=1 Tax=Candidatus Entotheonella palauensis TaxID=93172 RepID=UPI000B7D15BB|nr:amidohydrolase family protein [Candidatus Entotheonella palauensis]